MSSSRNTAPRSTSVPRAIVTGTGDVREFEDPRNYFEFELFIFDQEGMLKSSLAQRAATGSGGEYQIPLYVSMAAALAATYQDRKRGESGMALAVFDEAFNRLDVRNLQQCSGFLRDVGLQTVLAAPDEKHAVFMAEVDCLVNLIRSGEHVHLTIEWPRERTREALRREDPRRRGLEAFRALSGPLPQLERTLLEKSVAIEQWFRGQWQEHTPPFYCSVDLRNSGVKLAPVDTNLFPGGFNNLNPDFHALCVQAAQTAIEKICPDARDALLIPAGRRATGGFHTNAQPATRDHRNRTRCNGRSYP